ncbi:glycoside hydrolase N-terminal domain-containing protein [Cellulomonas sp. FA1]|uniref:glycoside hydrolase N-terminal domain-containing protein n=1 Tax=Cellulomonas sp. FA1 TaxID=1346710 RepID=UPI0013649889|nr:glycoside hydrolase N-terminal domain-containing protein [Cellulomonas sp. FA1]
MDDEVGATTRLQLRLDAPAERWTDAFPVGNGRLGAMVHGGTAHELVQVNDDTCWSGAPLDGPPRPVGPLGDDDPPAVVERARARLAAGDPLGAEREVQRLQTGWSQAYQPLVDVELDHPAAAGDDGYRRVLDLGRGVVTTTWRAADGTPWRQDVRVSHPDRALLLERASLPVVASPGPRRRGAGAPRRPGPCPRGRAPHRTTCACASRRGTRGPSPRRPRTAGPRTTPPAGVPASCCARPSTCRRTSCRTTPASPTS